MSHDQNDRASPESPNKRIKLDASLSSPVAKTSVVTQPIDASIATAKGDSNGFLQQSEAPPDALAQPNGEQQHKKLQPPNHLQPRGTQEDDCLLEPIKGFLSSAVKPQPDVIDLTDDADDDPTVVMPHKTQTMEVPKGHFCFGIIVGEINANRVPAFPAGREHLPMVIKLTRSRNPLSLALDVYDCRGEVFGYVDIATARVLVPLIDLKVFVIEPYLYAPPKEQIPANADISSRYNFFFNIYGPVTEATKVARIASQQKKPIQVPHKGYSNASVPYMDPNMPPTAPRAAPLGSPVVVTRTPDELRDDFNKVFEALDQAGNLPEMDADSRIKTPLLKHQKQGLYFLTMKEKERNHDDNDVHDTQMWLKKGENGQTWFHNIMTDETAKRRPPDVLGGILADMMGLGKTLQILSLVVSTLERSEEFAKGPKPRQHSVKDKTEPLPPAMNAKTTLLISPLSTISNWEEQIQAHVQDGAMKFHLYHGSKRECDPKVIAGYDLVITTYQVIASEWSKHLKNNNYVSPMQRINFFRIVLDEAHMIREQNTLQSKAVIALHAQRRWAVTGTPVQNRLDDLAALTKFLQLKPFDEKLAFNKYITTPLKIGDDNGLRCLRLLVDSVTLRRQKDKIDLPPRKDQIVYLKFSPGEQEIYDAAARQSSKRVDMVTKKGHIGGKNYVHILQMILRLRLICAHGRELLGDEDAADLAGLTSSDAINVDELDEGAANLSAKQAYQIFSLMKETNEDNCSICQKKAVYKEPVLTADENINVKAEGKGGGEGADNKGQTKCCATIGFLTPCTHMLCGGCIQSYIDKIPGDFEPGMRAVCPICALYGRISFFELKSDELNEHLAGANASKITKKKDFKYRGPSTKVQALIQALLENREAGTPEDPIKSVVFSCWTSHMDLLELAFEKNGISYVRLDGSLSRVQRSAAITQFRDAPTVEVIMVSLMAGGLGLNLTAASRVYMMEPQWNPAAEAQAIDRIHRLGQKKPVVCVRYIMSNSFEEKILEIQEKKTTLANMTMERGMSKAKIMQDRLAHLRNLFHTKK